MTINNIASQIYNMTTDRKVNGIKRKGVADMARLLDAWLRKEDDRIIFEINLPDGHWYVKVIRKGSYYDYYIPDTREQEQRLIAELFGK